MSILIMAALRYIGEIPKRTSVTKTRKNTVNKLLTLNSDWMKFKSFIVKFFPVVDFTPVKIQNNYWHVYW